MGRTRHAVRGPRSTARSGGGGFTLIELVALLTVLGTLAVLAVPALGRLDDSRAGLASARVRTVVAYAQRWAMATLDPTWVVVDTSANRIEVLTASSTNPSTTSVAQTGPVPTSTALQPVVNPSSGSALVLDLAD